MPLTKYQKDLAILLAVNRSSDSHLAGGAALNFSPSSTRYSNDLDYFHDSTARVAEAFENDAALLKKNNYLIEIELNQPGYIRAIVKKGSETTKLEWAHDSAWRFLPPLSNPILGYQLHPIDLAINKVLALVGRDEARDFLDVMFVHEKVLTLGALCWAAVGKDPGFTPISLLELLKRRGKYHQEDFSRLMLQSPVDLVKTKQLWLGALEQTEKFIRVRPPEEIGCLYYSPSRRKFVEPAIDDTEVIPHFGCPGGVLPQIYMGDNLVDQITDDVSLMQK